MKFRVSLKDPDGFSESVSDAVRDSIDEITGLSAREKSAIHRDRKEEVWDKLNKFVKYGEYVTIEFDTEEGTATVVPTGC